MRPLNQREALDQRLEALEAAIVDLERRVKRVETQKRDKRTHMLSAAQMPRSPAGGAGPR